MKRIIFFISLLISVGVFAQDKPSYTIGLPGQTSHARGNLRVDSTFLNPLRDTTFTPWRLGLQIFRPADSSLYVSTSLTASQKWTRLGSGSAVGDSSIFATRYWTNTQLATKQNSLTTGTTDEYFRGDLSLSNFSSDVTAITDGLYSTLGHTHDGLSPIGGLTGYILKKNSNTDYDYSWQPESGSGTINSGTLDDIPTYTGTGTTIGPTSGFKWNSTDKKLVFTGNGSQSPLIEFWDNTSFVFRLGWDNTLGANVVDGDGFPLEIKGSLPTKTIEGTDSVLVSDVSGRTFKVPQSAISGSVVHQNLANTALLANGDYTHWWNSKRLKIVGFDQLDFLSDTAANGGNYGLVDLKVTKGSVLFANKDSTAGSYARVEDSVGTIEAFNADSLSNVKVYPGHIDFNQNGKLLKLPNITGTEGTLAAQEQFYQIDPSNFGHRRKLVVNISGTDTTIQAATSGVDSIWRTPGIDSIFFKINDVTYKIKDSVGGGGSGSDTLLVSNTAPSTATTNHYFNPTDTTYRIFYHGCSCWFSFHTTTSTPGGGGYVFDNAEAEDYITRLETAIGGTVNDTRKAAIDDFITGMKTTSSGATGTKFSKLSVFWPLGGGTAAGTAVEFFDNYNITWNGSVTHSLTTGVNGDGSSGYGATSFNPSTQLSTSGLTVIVDIINNVDEAGADFGSYLSSTEFLGTYARTSGAVGIYAGDISGGITTSTSTSVGRTGTRRAGSVLHYFKDGSLITGNGSYGGTLPNQNMYILGLNQSGTAAQFSTKQFNSLLVFNDDLTDTEMADVDALLATFKTAWR